MKATVIISMVALLIYSTGINAKKCSYEIDKTDEFSGKIIKMTSATLAKSWKIGFSRNDTIYAVSLVIVLPGEINTGINQGDSLYVKLKNNEIIKLTASNNVAPRTYVAGSGAYAAVLSDFSPVYECTKEEIMKIIQSPVKIVRVFVGQQFLETPVDEKNGKKISDAAGCILE
jgi:hypothetical protein